MNDVPALPDPDLMKRMNRRFVTGVTVVTVVDGDLPRRLVGLGGVREPVSGLTPGSPPIREEQRADRGRGPEAAPGQTHSIFTGRVVDAAAMDIHPVVYSAERFFDRGALSPLG